MIDGIFIHNEYYRISFIVPRLTRNPHDLAMYFCTEDSNLTKNSCIMHDRVPNPRIDKYFTEELKELNCIKYKNEIIKEALAKRHEAGTESFGTLFLKYYPKYDIPNIVELAMIYKNRFDIDRAFKNDYCSKAFEIGCTSSTIYTNPHYRYVIKHDLKSLGGFLGLEGFSNARTTIPIIHI